MKYKRKSNNFFIDPLIFMIAFTLGILYTYVMHDPEKKHVIIKFPTAINGKNNDTYHDDAGLCYTYTVIPVTCPEQKKDVFVVPIQTSLQTRYADAVPVPKKTSLPKRLYQRFF